MSHKHINISTLRLDVEGEFIAKLKLLTVYFESRMNGATAHQMQKSSAEGRRYKLNYGVSLGDMRVMAEEIKRDEKVVLGIMDYDNLWSSDIREAMLLALLMVPNEEVTVDRIERWVGEIHTNEMADMLPFLMGWRVGDGRAMVEQAVNRYEESGVLQRIAYTNLVGRLVSRGKVERGDEMVKRYMERLATESIEEANSIMFLRNMVEVE
ncbi:MAG: DNA alkylation repair protein [Bacteroidia bacterium]|nr:DNA alkylation repair protein [Bacteroidia bacterium]